MDSLRGHGVLSLQKRLCEGSALSTMGERVTRGRCFHQLARDV